MVPSCCSKRFSGWDGQGLGSSGPLVLSGFQEATQIRQVHSGLTCMKHGSRRGGVPCVSGAPLLGLSPSLQCSFSCRVTMGY